MILVTVAIDRYPQLWERKIFECCRYGVYDLPIRAYSIDLPLESMPAVTVESNGKAFRLRVNRKLGQAEGEAVISLFPKSKKYSTTMHAIEGGQRSPPTTFFHWVVTDEQELAKCREICAVAMGTPHRA